MAFYPLEKLVNLQDGYRQVFRLEGLQLLLIQEHGQRYLLRNMCPHKGFPLHTGTLTGTRLRCAYHAIEFDLSRDGRCIQHPTQPGVQMYELTYEDNMIGVVLRG